MKLKILTALLVAIGFTLVACGGNDAPAPNAGGNESTGNTGQDAPGDALVYEIGIDGMTWGTGWVKSAEAALKRLDGVNTVKVSFMDKNAIVTMKSGAELTEETAKKAVAEGGDESGNNFSLTSFKKAQ